MDSGCSKHMIGSKNQFLLLEGLKGGNVSFGNGKKGEIIGVEKKELDNQLASIRSDHGTEFENAKFAEFCDEHGIDHNFSSPRTPQQNGVVERKNKILEDMARTMLHSKENIHVVFDETNILSVREEHENEAIGLVKELSEVSAQDKVAPKEGTGDGTATEHGRNIKLKLVGCETSQLDEDGTVTMNKTRLVVQGYSQEEGINYDEIFAPIARLEAIRLLIAFAAHMESTLHQMDVKSVFLNGYLKEEVFVRQPLGFESKECPKHVYKLDKALYGLK
ncbi:uncharacterized protein [Nicotiana sylvestris]|uniref:uncharacterized protein n=1 Tax=Nicotiana sylvestris TaxID=4096 RepID=UPI00388CC989